MISEEKKSGLLLCKAHHAEFVGPGAAVGTFVEQECTAVIAIGSPEIVAVTTVEERQKAYSRRIQWLRWLEKIAKHPEPTQRAEKLFSNFQEFFGNHALTRLPDDVLGLLIGVLPATIAAARAHYHLTPFNPGKTALIYPSIEVAIIALGAHIPHTLEEQLASTTGSGQVESHYTLSYTA